MHLNNVNIQGQEHGLWSQQSADMAVDHDALVQWIRVINDTVGQNDAGVASGTFLKLVVSSFSAFAARTRKSAAGRRGRGRGTSAS